MQRKVENVFKPLKWQVGPWQNLDPIMLLTGAAGGGKSRIAAEKFHALHLKYPGSTGVVGRKDKTAANRSVVPFLLHTVMSGTNWGTFKKSEQMFQYRNGSQIWVIGLRDENQREALRSIGRDGSVDFVWMEEANKLTLADHYEILTRMRGTFAPFRQIIYSTNPDSPDHWIKRYLIDKAQAAVFYSRPEDNPSNPKSYIEALQSLTGVYYERMWKGRWVQAEGVIYTEYDREKHLMESYVPAGSRGYKYVLSVDFGYTAPFSATLWEQSPKNRKHMDGVIRQVAQIYRTKRLVEEHAIDIKRMLGSIVPDAIVCDHDAEDRATLEKHLGMKTKPAYKAIMPGIEAVKARFRDGTLLLNQSAVWHVDMELEKAYLPTRTSEEISGYAWDEKKPDTPLGENDHGCDEMRYAICEFDDISKTTAKITSDVDVDNILGKPETNNIVYL